MFRKAKKLSKRLGLNKDNCTATNGVAMNHYKGYISDESVSEKHPPPPPPQFTMSIDRASDSLTDDDSTSTTSTESKDLKLSPRNTTSPNTNRPMLAKCSTAPEPKSVYDDAAPITPLQRQFSMADAGNLDHLLSMETQARLDAQAEREKEQQQQLLEEDTKSAPRPTRIKFELPETLPRSRSPARAYPRARPVRSLPEEGLTANATRHPLSPKSPRRIGWRYLFGDRQEDQVMKQTHIPITIGTRVRLKMRPLPTFGYVRYMGAVAFGKGEYIGIELDHRVGNCDGSIDGIRYFVTDPHRGTFAKRRELEAVAE